MSSTEQMRWRKAMFMLGDVNQSRTPWTPDQGAWELPGSDGPDGLFSPFVLPRPEDSIFAGPVPHALREALVEIRTEVIGAMGARKLRALLICGIEAGAGTSFLTGHLARQLAEFTGRQTAVLRVRGNREKSARPGATARTRVELSQRRTELANLMELVALGGDVSLPDLLRGDYFVSPLREIRREFDLLIIDGPPVMKYRETALLAARMDGVILIAEPGVTPRRWLRHAHARLRRARADILGMVFNRCHST
ncbi:MAG: hypothetical protein ACKV2V_08025 [Blastocatellia bacterium]